MEFRRWLVPRPNALVLGPRRAGKTTLLRRAFPDFAYATLDDFDVLRAARQDPKGLIQELGPRFILDEIQREPTLTLAVKQVLDESRAQVLMTGSSGLRLLEASADTLAGRIDVMHLPPMAFGESEGAPASPEVPPGPLALANAHRSIKEFMVYGGFPEVCAAADPASKQTILKRYRDTYFLRDLAQLSNLENVDGLLALLYHIGRCIGSPVDFSALSRGSGLSVPTVKKYLGALAYAELIFRVEAFGFAPEKRLQRASKYYFADNGILTALNVAISQGQLAENFVISEIEKRRKIGLTSAPQLYYYRTVHGAEVDLVFSLEASLSPTRTPRAWIAAEVKSGESFDAGDTRNLRKFVSENPGSQGVLFYGGRDFQTISHDVRAVPIAALAAGGWLSP